MEFRLDGSPDALPWKSVYKLMIGSIVPRPIGWVSTVNAAGQPNLAPFSFFNAICPNPPHVLFCPMIRNTDGSTKDTLANVRATGEFVINIVSEPILDAMNISATEFPSDVNEFEAAGLTPVPSQTVKPPRVLESAIHYECVVSQIIDVADQPGGGSVVIGRVLHLHVREDVFIAPDKINLEQLQAVGRLAGSSYVRVSDVFDLARPESQVVKK